jgi:hypothetical protein
MSRYSTNSTVASNLILLKNILRYMIYSSREFVERYNLFNQIGSIENFRFGSKFLQNFQIGKKFIKNLMTCSAIYCCKRSFAYFCQTFDLVKHFIIAFY